MAEARRGKEAPPRLPYLRRRYTAGDQNRFADRKPRIAALGCGLIALSDLLLYLRGIGSSGCVPRGAVSLRCGGAYSGYVCALNRRAAVRPLIGLNGLSMARTFNRYAKKRGWRCRARWAKLSDVQLLETVRRMLAEDIPAILSVGPGFSGEGGARGIKLFEMREEDEAFAGAPVRAGEVGNHYMTAIGMIRIGGREYFRVVSWGRCYLISVEEYLRGREKLPLFGTLFSSVLEIRQSGDRSRLFAFRL
ncbi:MAG: hypothetical protein ACTTK0_07300 [Stomatobaculum sp.]